MARDTEALKVVKWAGGPDGSENRADIPVSLMQDGWDQHYSQVGGSRGPERLFVNELLARATALLTEVKTGGLPLPWSDAQDYPHTDEGASFVTGKDGKIHRSLAPSGPGTGNEADPTDSGQTVWRVY